MKINHNEEEYRREAGFAHHTPSLQTAKKPILSTKFFRNISEWDLRDPAQTLIGLMDYVERKIRE
jgi:hypothetical protein